MLEADYILHARAAGNGRHAGRMERAVNEILRHQNEDGGWSLYPGGPSNVNYGVKCYLALKLMGWTADHPVLVKARKWVLALGGVVECNTFTKIYLCSLGQYDYDAVPAVPPEIVAVSELVLLQYLRDQRVVAGDPGAAVDYLCEEAVQEAGAGAGRSTSCLWAGATRRICICGGTASTGWLAQLLFVSDRVAHWAERVHIRPLRKMALKKAEQWMLERFERSDGLGAIYPAMLNAIVALRVPGVLGGRSAVDPGDGRV